MRQLSRVDAPPVRPGKVWGSWEIFEWTCGGRLRNSLQQTRPNQTPAEAAGLQIYLKCTDHRQGPRSSSGSANDSTHSRPKGGLAPQHWGEGPLPLLVYLGVRGGPLGSRLEGGLQRKAAGREHPRPPAQPDAAVNVHLVV